MRNLLGSIGIPSVSDEPKIPSKVLPLRPPRRERPLSNPLKKDNNPPECEDDLSKIDDAVALKIFKKLPRTTAFNHRQNAAVLEGGSKTKKPRRQYGSSGCKVCTAPFDTKTHPYFHPYHGSRYCPERYDISYMEWKKLKLADKKAKIAFDAAKKFNR